MTLEIRVTSLYVHFCICILIRSSRLLGFQPEDNVIFKLPLFKRRQYCIMLKWIEVRATLFKMLRLFADKMLHEKNRETMSNIGTFKLV